MPPRRAEVERLFQRHIDRAMAEVPRYFARLPAAPFRLRPLEASLSGLTFGFMSHPSPAGASPPADRVPGYPPARPPCA